ncbi:sigma-54-dependent Fis family transcriptional regulator [Frigoriglobus tundricola]|uniref:Formate hydrogenlyase transcriptional activator n=1 Tax=Frigoriglobus tundricola TaxID=2774151 RepID=A0A6M5YL24_9BACT|nr:sigma 54-interacting transcriptional regulator [Frigoriglobus tundricola]QJW94050.1 Formate hydrogenlyase transcriptional activator [Frigoriglobus tundricola]
MSSRSAPPAPAPHGAPGLVTSPVTERPGVLLSVAQAVAAHADLGALLRDLAAALSTHLPAGYLSFALIDPHSHTAKLQFLEPLAGSAPPKPADTPTELPAAESPTAHVWDTQRPLWLGAGARADGRFAVLRSAYAKQGVRSACFVPLTTPRRKLGAMGFTSYAPVAPVPGDVEFATMVGRLVALAVEGALTRQELQRANDRLAAEKLYLEEEIRTDRRTDDVVGTGSALRDVLRQVGVVAPTDSAVLITGETGTGKELIARAVHRQSHRHDRTFVKLNCAAIPTGLLESELFGHEKGAFTGAVERRLGRFELADGGTLFLDEVGDIPQELQPKLLRVLQEQEFERLGSAKTIKVNVRLVAATHRNLAKMVAEGKFRSDLYYRLHVFPVHLPALRERREDVPELVRHFVGLFARRFGKTIESVPTAAMAALERYAWPGNVRELEHLIERAVILTPGGALRVPLAELTGPQPDAPAPLPPAPSPVPPTLKESERDLIRRTLHECGWVVGGPSGAAARLGLKRTTLLSRMKNLGISRPSSSPVE